jgi:hypothetical protein
MDVDTAAADFDMDPAMDFDMGNEFLLDDGFGRAASETSLVTGSNHKRAKNNKQVRFIVSCTYYS